MGTAAGAVSLLLAALCALPSGFGAAAGPAPPSGAPSAAELAIGGAARAVPPRASPLDPSSSPPDAWANWTGATGPGPRSSAMVAFDSALNATFLFGGRSSSGDPLNDTWEFANGSWTNVTASVGPAPPARWGGGFVYDAVLGVAVLFGGENGSAFFGDTWTFSGSAWTRAAAVFGPSPRTAALGYNPFTGNILLYGGGFENLSAGPGPWIYYNDTWQFRAGAWTNLTPVIGTGPTGPGALVYDAANRLYLLVGGDPSRNHAWLYYKAGWHLAYAPNGPSPSALNWSAAYDGEGQYVLLEGGASAGGAAGTTWAFRDESWTNLTKNLSIAPPPRDNASMVDDPAEGVVLYVAGTAGSNARNDTWAFSGVPFRLELRISPSATDVGLAVTLTDSLNETTGAGLTYSYAYGHLPPGCLSGNNATLECAPLAADSYLVNTTVTRSDGVAENATAPLLVAALPSVGAYAPITVADVGQNLTFFANTSNGTAPFRYGWAFGDRTPNGSGRNVTHAFDLPGTYTVNVTLTDAVGSVATASVEVTVHPGLELVVSSNRSASDTGVPIGFTASPSNGTAPYEVSWSFPGGGTVEGTTVSHAFANPGVYRVNVTATDAYGMTAASSLEVTVDARPSIAAFANRTVTDVDLPIALSANATGGVAPLSVQWVLSDGATASGNATSHAFALAGPAWARVTVVDRVGLAATAVVNLTLHAAPSLALSESAPPCVVGSPVDATLSAAVAGGTGPFNITWQFGDGSPSASGASVTHAFGYGARFDVRASVTDAAGATNGSSITVNATCPSSGTQTVHRGASAGGGGWTLTDSALVGLALAVVVVVGAVLWRRRRPPAAVPEPVPIVLTPTPRPTDRPAWAEDDEPPAPVR